MLQKKGAPLFVVGAVVLSALTLGLIVSIASTPPSVPQSPGIVGRDNALQVGRDLPPGEYVVYGTGDGCLVTTTAYSKKYLVKVAEVGDAWVTEGDPEYYDVPASPDNTILRVYLSEGCRLVPTS